MTRNDTGTQDLIAPLQQEGTKAVLRTWLKKHGEVVRKDEPVVELETDKVVVEVCAPCDGVLNILMKEDTAAEPGALLGRVSQATPAPAPATAAAPAESEKRPEAAAAAADLRLSPAVRRLVAEHDLDPSQIQGSGRGGRLTREDVIAVLAAPAHPATAEPRAQAPSPASTSCVPAPVANMPSASGPEATHVPHSSMRRRIAEHMHHSVTTAPHVTAVFEADFTAIINHRKRHKAAFAEKGVNLTFTAYFVAAAAQAMAAAPEVNSRWHADYLELFRDINIGVGAALGDKGLIVPVIHRVQDLSLLGIASRLQLLTEAARSGKLKPEDVQGGTFTISNHGVSGSLFASPIIINQPQSAILGIGALEKRVVVREIDGVESIQARPMAYVSLTIDHRVLDGGQTNAWLTRFVEVIQNWPQDA
ncbi:dihydrolipoamide succinyltransferase [Pseudomonas sp. BN411]|nr:dihydrolipoamide succinyltransferase [Pseudomonas sp. BN411]